MPGNDELETGWDTKKRCSSTHNPNSISTLGITSVRSQLPALAAFFDSLIEVHSDPPTGCDLRTLDHLLRDWERHLVRGVEPVLRNGELKPRCVEIMESLKPENRPYFEAMVKELDSYFEKTFGTRHRRKKILHTFGTTL